MNNDDNSSNTTKNIIGILKGAKFLASFSLPSLPIFGVIIATIMVSFIFIFGFNIMNDAGNCDIGSGATKGLTAKVMRFKEPIKQEMDNQKLNEAWLNLLLAHVQQESGGDAERYPDIFQASESMGLAPNSLDTNSSIRQGVKFFKAQLATVKSVTGHNPSPTNEGDVNISTVLYNAPAFGPWLKKNYGGVWSVEANDRFYTSVLPTYGAGPGDKNYWKHILQYYDIKSGDSSVGMNSNDCDNTGGVEGSAKGKAIINEAQKYLGVPYVWGGKNPSTGMDCSGFVGYVLMQVTKKSYPQYTVSLESKGKMLFDGGKPNMKQLQPGDMLFWGTHGASYHVAFYMGDGKIIEEPKPGDVCKIIEYKSWVPDFAVRP